MFLELVAAESRSLRHQHTSTSNAWHALQDTGYLMSIVRIDIIQYWNCNRTGRVCEEGNATSYHHYSQYPIYVYAADQSSRLDGT